MIVKYIKCILLVAMLLPSGWYSAQAQSVSKPEELNKALKFLYGNMVYVGGGTYLKGEKQVPTTVNSFYCCRYETVYWLWRLLMYEMGDEDDMLPVMGPTWTDCQKFIERLNHYAGRRYRLLTDDEWEFAARGGNLSKGYIYAGSNNIDEVAWYEGNYGDALHRVGEKRPNELGLYDMSGNAEEWCQDSVPSKSVRRREPIADIEGELPEAPDFGIDRIVRGGCLISSPMECSVYVHYGQPADWAMGTIGFRLALDVSEYNYQRPLAFRVMLNGGDSQEADSIGYDTNTNKLKFHFTNNDGSTGTQDIDISQVNYVSRVPMGSVEIPKGANLKMSDIVLIGDGQRQEMDDTGSFNGDADNLIAMNDEQIVYLSYGCGEKERKLNSEETAMSMLLPAIPYSISDMDEIQLYLLKRMIGYLDETKVLTKTIDESIGLYGYMDMDFIMPQYKAAVKAIMDKFGIKPNVQSHTTRLKVAPNPPYFSSTKTNEAYGDGFTLIMENSNWTKDAEGDCWSCGFTLYNAYCRSYTTLTKCYRNPDDGLYYRINDELYDTFKYLVRPMNVSAFMDWGTLSDLVTKPNEFLDTLSDPDFEKLMTFLWESVKPLGNFFGGDYDYFTEATWDKVKVSKIQFDFHHSDENVMIAGPGIDGNLLLFNVMKLFFQPALKLLMGKIKKTDGYEDLEIWDKLTIGFIDWMAKADLKFRAELLAKIEDPSISWIEKLEVFPEVFERFKSYCYEVARKTMSEAIWDGAFKPCFESADYDEIKAIFKLYKNILSAGDFVLMCLDINYNGIGFDIKLDFTQPQGTLPIAPGEDL